jgi:hypothetical protein
MFVPHISRASAQIKRYSFCHGLPTLHSSALRHLCICCKASQHTNQITIALQHLQCLLHVTATCRSQAALAQKLCDLRCWHKTHAIASKPRIASHVEVAASPSSSASAAPPACSMAGGGGRSAFLLFVRRSSSLRSSRLPCQWLQCISQH